jgi:hypothetical protein
MYASSCSVTNDEDERSMAHMFYFVAKDGNAEAIRLIDSMTEKIADYLEGSLNLIRDGLIMQFEEQKAKDAESKSWRELFS